MRVLIHAKPIKSAGAGGGGGDDRCQSSAMTSHTLTSLDRARRYINPSPLSQPFHIPLLVFHAPVRISIRLLSALAHSHHLAELTRNASYFVRAHVCRQDSHRRPNREFPLSPIERTPVTLGCRDGTSQKRLTRTMVSPHPQAATHETDGLHAFPVLAPHFDIDFAAPKGPNPPIDQGSVEVRPSSLLLFSHSQCSALSGIQIRRRLRQVPQRRIRAVQARLRQDPRRRPAPRR